MAKKKKAVVKKQTPEQKQLHALRQQASKARKKLEDLTDPRLIMRQYRTIIELNSKQEQIRESAGIKKRKNKVVKRAIERSGKAEGIERTYFFYDYNKLKRLVYDYMRDGVITTLNGIDTKRSPVKALSYLDILFENLDSEKAVKTLLDPSKKDMTVWLTQKGDSDMGITEDEEKEFLGDGVFESEEKIKKINPPKKERKQKGKKKKNKK